MIPGPSRSVPRAPTTSPTTALRCSATSSRAASGRPSTSSKGCSKTSPRPPSRARSTPTPRPELPPPRARAPLRLRAADPHPQLEGTEMRSAMRAISSKWWLETSTPQPRAATSCSIARTSTTPDGSRAFAGSSSTSNSGCPSSAPASPTRCRLPRESVLARRSAQASRRIAASALAEAAAASVPRRPRSLAVTVTLSRAVSSPYSAGVSTRCPTNGHIEHSPRTRRSPSTSMSPASGSCMPSASRISVVLPAPLRPMSAWISPPREAIRCPPTASPLTASQRTLPSSGSSQPSAFAM